MASQEYCYEHADELALEVVNAHELHFGSESNPDFKELLELAVQYQSAPESMRETFAKAVKKYQDKHTSRDVAQLCVVSN
jgi:hypothetical protein